MVTMGYITLECNRGDHSSCSGFGVLGHPFGNGSLKCECVHHLPGVTIPDGIRGCISPSPFEPGQENWAEKTAKAKEARSAGREARRNKPKVFRADGRDG